MVEETAFSSELGRELETSLSAPSASLIQISLCPHLISAESETLSGGKATDYFKLWPTIPAERVRRRIGNRALQILAPDIWVVIIVNEGPAPQGARFRHHARLGGSS
jgi:hypothetical protein